jgi:DNA-binding GntR family transcriptional regulator
MEISSQLRDGAELYRRWSHSLGDDSLRDVPGEHRALLRALMDRDEVAAVEVLRQHISLTTDVLLEYLQLESG